MMITEQERKRRRLTYRLVQVVLVVLSVGIVMAFLVNKRGGVEQRADPEMRITANPPGVTSPQGLGPGDAQIFNVDSTVDLILSGDRIYAGLSPKSVEKIRAEIHKAGPDDSNTIGGMIAKTVKDQVADKIDIHVSYDIRDIEDIRYEDGRIVIDWRQGGDRELFSQIKRDGRRGDANDFRREDALRFIELLKARQRTL
jgi:hypothetical protein